MKLIKCSLLGSLALVAPSVSKKLPEVTDILPGFANILIDEISLSGVSSGGAMAIQMHVAFSQSITKVGVFAAAPYW